MFSTRYSRKSVKGVRFCAPSHTVQDCKTDINSMVQRVLLGDSTALKRGVYADVSGSPESLQDIMLIRSRANTIWHDLPDSLRQAVGSPERLIEQYDIANNRFIDKDKDVNSANKNVNNVDNNTVTAPADKTL